MRKALFQILKLAIAFSLIGYMIYTDRLDLKAIYASKSNYHLIALALLLILSANFVNFYRWNLLLKGQQIFLKAKEVISLCFIGLFFTTVLPGAVGGDLVKSVYIAKQNPDKRTAAVLTVLLDRMMGLVALIIIACIGLLFNFNSLMKNQALKSLGIFIYLILFAFAGLFLLGLSRRIYNNKYIQLILSKLPLSKAISKIYTAFHAYRNNHKALTYSLLVSFITHTLNISAFYVLALALGFNELNFSSYIFIVPIGLITTAIPLAPAGIGIGQAAFLKLFQWSLGYQTTIGADIITLVQALSILIFLFGGIFYIGYKKKVNN